MNATKRTAFTPPVNASTTTPTTAAGDATPKKYQTMIIGIGAPRKELHTAMMTLSKKLGCRISDLVMEFCAAGMAKPPTVAPAGSSPSGGSARGFWVVPLTDEAGRATAIRIVEVENRSNMTGGRTFFRYSEADETGRKRAHNQAVRAAQYDCKLLGMDAKTIKIKRLPE